MAVNSFQEWDNAYKNKTQMSIWPWSDLVSYVYRYLKPMTDFHRVLELGCGAGANIPLFLHLGFHYHAVESSQTAVTNLHQDWPQLSKDILVGDFTENLPEGPFDLIVDRSALPHNNIESIRHALQLAFDRLRPGGKFIGVDWFSTEHAEFGKGEKESTYSYNHFTSGQFKGIGIVYFFDQHHLLELLADAGFVLEHLEHKKNNIVYPEPYQRAWWNFVATK